MGTKNGDRQVEFDDLVQAANAKAGEHIENAKACVRANLGNMCQDSCNGLLASVTTLAMRSQLFLEGKADHRVLAETVKVYFSSDFMPVLAAALLIGSLSMVQIVAEHKKGAE